MCSVTEFIPESPLGSRYLPSVDMEDAGASGGLDGVVVMNMNENDETLEMVVNENEELSPPFGE